MAKKETAKTVEKTVNTGFIDNVEALEAKMKEMREAQKVFATFTQEQVDKIFYEAAMAANKARIPLARQAVEETQRGILEDKVIKNHYAAEYIYNAYKDTKTCGVIEEDKAYGIKKIAEPIGLVAAVIPTTNPTSTAIFKTLICLKTRNAIIVSPHPAAKASTIAGIIADESAIGMINQKTTAVRVIPVIGKGVGETVEFGGLLGYAPIMPVNQFSCDAFVERGGRIPAPIHSFKN